MLQAPIGTSVSIGCSGWPTYGTAEQVPHRPAAAPRGRSAAASGFAKRSSASVRSSPSDHVMQCIHGGLTAAS